MDISRSQLADWDASARACLRTADGIKAKEQRQLMSLLERVDLSVSEDLQVYSSIISAWISALESMEKLICGMPQAVNSGLILLALGAWYLYPDVVVLGCEPFEICVKDSLIAPGGTITIGLAKPGSEVNNGLYWSLSLAHLKHYGCPVLTQGQLNYTSARITFRQFCQAVFGCLLGFWKVPETRLQVWLGSLYYSKILSSLLQDRMGALKTTRSRCTHGITHTGST